ncbi:hypothetical protein DXG01_016083 [Tephrocybe rancida]|nr:hypothetical protein DXG01_016083 [Tephrocybe rancida]
MTRSALSPHGPEIAKKVPIAPGMGRRTHGSRMEQSYWNGRAFVIVGDDIDNPLDPDVCVMDGPNCEICAIEDEPPYVLGNDGLGREPPAPVLSSLLDIAKPAKPKGIAKDFEVVDSVTRIIAFEDDAWEDYSSLTQGDDDFWEEWDDVYQEPDIVKEKKLSYSAIVGKDSSVEP